MVNGRGIWRVVDRGVNGKPFIWKKRATTKYVMIDIFNLRRRRCYAVFALKGNPMESRSARGKLIGMGCADSRSGWVGAYEKARRIADEYMDGHAR
jgi:hypothetical protein